ncbi:MAG: ATP-binding protein [Candidatus Gastranaerophilaceae bacterium]
MITSKDCWLKETCKKYNDLSKPCECRDNDSFCMKLFKLDALYNASLLPDSQRKKLTLFTDLDGTDELQFKTLANIQSNIVEFVNEGKNLYIHSSITGNGKTAWSVRFIQAYFNRIWPKVGIECKALFINVPRFLLALKDNISSKNDYVEHIKANVLNADLVVWDEVGTKGLTQFEHEHLLNLINARIDCGKSNIYTSNLAPQELKEAVGDRLYSRIVNLSIEIELHGKDKRRLNVQ